MVRFYGFVCVCVCVCVCVFQCIKFSFYYILYNLNILIITATTKNAVHQLVEINEDFTVCYHNEFV